MCWYVFTLLIPINSFESINNISNAKTFPVHLSPLVSSWGCITWDPLPPRLPTYSPHSASATGDETDSSHISAQLDGMFIITTQQGSDRERKQQRERWRSGGNSGGGEGLRLAEGLGGGKMNRRREGVGSYVMLKERPVPLLCQGVSVFFLYACMCVLVPATKFWIGNTTNTRQRKDNEKKLMKRENW